MKLCSHATPRRKSDSAAELPEFGKTTRPSAAWDVRPGACGFGDGACANDTPASTPATTNALTVSQRTTQGRLVRAALGITQAFKPEARAPSPSALERVAEHQLCQTHESALIRDATESSVAESDGGVTAPCLDAVGDVQHLEPDLRAPRAAHPDVLRRYEVPVMAIRRADVGQGARCRAELELARLREPSGADPDTWTGARVIQPVLATAAGLDLRSRQVRALRPEAVRRQRVVVIVNRPREATLERNNRRERPVAEDGGTHATASPPLALAKRQLDDRREDDLVRHIEQPDPVLRVKIVNVVSFRSRARVSVLIDVPVF